MTDLANAPESPSDIAILCGQVTKTFGSGNAAVKALRGVDLKIRTGELMMLVGPSGCGKTTLISIVAGVMHRDGGECVVFGKDYAKMRRDVKWGFSLFEVMVFARSSM